MDLHRVRETRAIAPGHDHGHRRSGLPGEAQDQLVPGLPEALTRLADRHREGRAYSVFITGPSRTADIEKELVIPAHGPRELVVVLIA